MSAHDAENLDRQQISRDKCLNILLVEDNPGDARLIRESLSEFAGPTPVVRWVENLKDALQYLSRDTPDVVLLDLGLPDSTGLGTVQSVRAVAPWPAIVVLTGLDDERVATQALQAGVQDYLPKDAIASELLTRSIRLAVERKEIWEQLAERERQARSLLEGNVDGIVLVDGEGAISYANAASTYLLRQSSDTLVGAQFRFPVGGESPVEIELIREDGEPLVVEMRTASVHFEGRLSSLVSLRDITARKNADQEVTRARDEAQQYLDIAGVMLVAVGRDENVTLINKRGCETLGYSEKEILGQNWFDCFVPDRLKGKQGEIFDRGLAGDSTAVEYHESPILTRDGEERLIAWHDTVLTDASGNSTGVLSSGEDITDRTRAEEAQRRSEKRYRHLFEDSLAGVYLTNVAGEFLDCNAAFADLLGYSSCQEVMDAGSQKLYEGPADREAFLVALQQKGGVTNREALLCCKDGTLVWTIENARLLSDDDGNPSLIEGVVLDLSERMRAEEEQKLVADVLRVLNRPNEWQSLIRDILDMIQAFTGIEALGIRLGENGDYPYTAARGFPEEFLATASSLCAYNTIGAPILDAAGQPILECMCGNVLRGRTDPSFPFFTGGGSFWTNSFTNLLASTTEEERQARTRDFCRASGYESVALIPVRSSEDTIGLLQLNDKRCDRFDLKMIEFFEGLVSSIGVAYARQQAEQQIRLLLDRQTQLNRLSLELGQTLDLRETYATVYKHVCSLMDADGFIVSLFNPDDETLSASFVVNRGEECDTSQFPPIQLEEEGRGTQSHVVRTGKPLYVPNWEEAMENTHSRYRVLENGSVAKGPTTPDTDAERDVTRSALLVPMQVEGNMLGALQVQSHRLDAYGEDDMELLSGIGSVAAIALHSANRHQEVEQNAAVLRASLEGTIRALADTTEARDPYTAGHQKGVAELSVAIAVEMGLPKDTVETVHMAGLVHDIGKIATPAEILSKPGKLTDVEFGLIKVHSQSGYDILKGIDFPWPIADAVLQHHERMNGSGYPNGLVGDEICMEARILAVADVVEAMANHRPYRPALGIDAALDEIEKRKGDAYDLAVADACITLFRDRGFQFSA